MVMDRRPRLRRWASHAIEPLLVALVTLLWLLTCHLRAPWMLTTTVEVIRFLPTVFAHLSAAYLVILAAMFVWVVLRVSRGAYGGAHRLRALRARAPDPLIAVASGVVPTPRLFVLADEHPYALCAGLWRPAVYVSQGLLAAGDADEIRAVLAHEEAHRRRRDPLRILLAVTLGRLLYRLPWMGEIARQARLRAEVAADQFARRHAPTPALARSLLRVLRYQAAHPGDRTGCQGPAARPAAASLIASDADDPHRASFGERLRYLTLPVTAMLPSRLPGGISWRAALRTAIVAYRVQVVWAAGILLFLGGAQLAAGDLLRAAISCVFRV